MEVVNVAQLAAKQHTLVPDMSTRVAAATQANHNPSITTMALYSTVEESRQRGSFEPNTGSTRCYWNARQARAKFGMGPVSPGRGIECGK
jgi:hypothetical protein